MASFVIILDVDPKSIWLHRRISYFISGFRFAAVALCFTLIFGDFADFSQILRRLVAWFLAFSGNVIFARLSHRISIFLPGVEVLLALTLLLLTCRADFVVFLFASSKIQFLPSDAIKCVNKIPALGGQISNLFGALFNIRFGMIGGWISGTFCDLDRIQAAEQVVASSGGVGPGDRREDRGSCLIDARSRRNSGRV